MPPSEGHIESFYAKNSDSTLTFPGLKNDHSTHTCVIGGGLAGITCARQLAKAGHEVLLLEADRIGWAASGRNGGFVSAGFAEGMDAVVAKLGQKHAQELYVQSQRGVAYIESVLAELNAAHIIQGRGGINLVRHGSGEGLQQKAENYRRLFDVELDFIPKDRLNQFITSTTYRAGLYNKNAFHIDPLSYAQLLAQNASDFGAILFERSHVAAIRQQNGKWLIEANGSTVSAENVVLATSAYGGPSPLLEQAIVPVATYVVATKPLGEQLDDAIKFRGTISDTRRAGDYFRTLGEGRDRRLIWGGRITTRTSEPKQLAHLLKQDIVRIFPQLAELEIDAAWSGLMGYPRHKMPLIGQFWKERNSGLWACTGFGGHGLNTTAMGGCIVADALTGKEDKSHLFAPYQPVWTGGAIGRMAAQTSYWGMQLRDYLDERGTN